jgi:hypothetical protein
MLNGEDAVRLEEAVTKFRTELRKDGSVAGDRDYFATLALNLLSLARDIDKEHSLRLGLTKRRT